MDFRVTFCDELTYRIIQRRLADFRRASQIIRWRLASGATDYLVAPNVLRMAFNAWFVAATHIWLLPREDEREPEQEPEPWPKRL